MAQSLRPAAADAARARVIVKYRADSGDDEEAGDDGHRPAHPAGAGARRPDRRAARRAAPAFPTASHVVTAPRPELGQPGGSAPAPLPTSSTPVVDERKHIVAVPNDPFYASRPVTDDHRRSGGRPVWYLKPPGLDGPRLQHRAGGDQRRAGLGRRAAASAAPASSSPCRHTGLRFDHPTCSRNVVPGYDMIAADSIPTLACSDF